jgi:hypothetical protein
MYEAFGAGVSRSVRREGAPNCSRGGCAPRTNETHRSDLGFEFFPNGRRTCAPGLSQRDSRHRMGENIQQPTFNAEATSGAHQSIEN